AATIVQQGAIGVQNSLTISFLIGGIPVGTGYTVTLSAVSTDGAVTCGGSASFSIAAGATADISVLLQCNGTAPEARSHSIMGQPYECATPGSITALPAEATIGSSMMLTATATGANPSGLTYSWSAPSGTFSAPTSAATNFTCSATGTITLTVAVGDGPVPDGGSCNAMPATATIAVQ